MLCLFPYNQTIFTAVDLHRFALKSKQCSSHCSFMVTSSTCSVGSIYCRSSLDDTFTIWSDSHPFFLKLRTVFCHHIFRILSAFVTNKNLKQQNVVLQTKIKNKQLTGRVWSFLSIFQLWKSGMKGDKSPDFDRTWRNCKRFCINS